MRDQGLAWSRRWAESKKSCAEYRSRTKQESGSQNLTFRLESRPHSTLSLVPRYHLENKVSFAMEAPVEASAPNPVQPRPRRVRSSVNLSMMPQLAVHAFAARLDLKYCYLACRGSVSVCEMNVRRETRVDDDRLTNATARLVSTSLGFCAHKFANSPSLCLLS